MSIYENNVCEFSYFSLSLSLSLNLEKKILDFFRVCVCGIKRDFHE
jgi:hypothetical protein